MEASTSETRARWREYSRQRKIRLRELGLCTRCGKQPLSTRNHCEGCAREMNRKTIMQRRGMASIGLCTLCPQDRAKPLASKTMCEACLRKHNARSHRHYEERTLYVYDYFIVSLPGNLANTLREIGLHAITEAKDRARLHIKPATWIARHISGQPGDFHVTFRVCRKRRASTRKKKL